MAFTLSIVACAACSGKALQVAMVSRRTWYDRVKISKNLSIPFPAKWARSRGPMKAPRIPTLSRKARSTSSAVATPSPTRSTASLSSAACNRLTMKPGTSLFNSTGDLPIRRMSSQVSLSAWADVSRPPTTSTRGMR